MEGFSLQLLVVFVSLGSTISAGTVLLRISLVLFRPFDVVRFPDCLVKLLEEWGEISVMQPFLMWCQCSHQNLQAKGHK